MTSNMNFLSRGIIIESYGMKLYEDHLTHCIMNILNNVLSFKTKASRD